MEGLMARVRIQSTKGERMKRIRLNSLHVSRERPLVPDPVQQDGGPRRFVGGESSSTVEVSFTDDATALYFFDRMQQSVFVRVEMEGQRGRGTMRVATMRWTPRAEATVTLIGGREMKWTYPKSRGLAPVTSPAEAKAMAKAILFARHARA